MIEPAAFEIILCGGPFGIAAIGCGINRNQSGLRIACAAGSPFSSAKNINER